MPAWSRLLPLALIATLLAAAVEAQDKATVRIETRTYQVSGETLDEIADSIRRNRPRSVGRYIAETTFNYSWKYTFASAKGRCTITEPRVEIVIRVTLPEHRDIASVPAETARFWNRFIAVLERHENRHVEDFERIGAKIPSALDGLSAGSCLAAGVAANRKGNEFVAEAQASAYEYDMQTGHGISEGASFPGL